MTPQPPSGIREELDAIGRNIQSLPYGEYEDSIYQDEIDALEALITRERKCAVEEALRPATEGGLHVVVNLSGIHTEAQFLQVVKEIGNHLEVQKEIMLKSILPAPHADQ